jgi:hypothetical protein
MGKFQGAMDFESEKAPNSASSSAAAPIHKPYSAQEIGNIMNTKPLELMKMNIGFMTRWYDCEFIEEILRYVEEEPNIQILMTLIAVKWQRQVDERHPKVCRFDPLTRTWKPYVENLRDKLNEVFERVKAYRKHKEEERQMEEQWELMFGGKEQKTIIPIKTDIPSFKNDKGWDSTQVKSQPNTDIEYWLNDLPIDVRNHIRIEDDKLYSDFVVILKGPVKQWIGKHNLKDWNVVRFICRLRGIVSTKCSLHIFGKFLEKIGLGNQESNMKQRKDANKDSVLNDYDDPKKKQYFIQLKRDGDAIEKELKPIIEQLSA